MLAFLSFWFLCFEVVVNIFLLSFALAAGTYRTYIQLSLRLVSTKLTNRAVSQAQWKIAKWIVLVSGCLTYHQFMLYCQHHFFTYLPNFFLPGSFSLPFCPFLFKQEVTCDLTTAEIRSVDVALNIKNKIFQKSVFTSFFSGSFYRGQLLFFKL